MIIGRRGETHSLIRLELLLVLLLRLFNLLLHRSKSTCIKRVHLLLALLLLRLRVAYSTPGPITANTSTISDWIARETTLQALSSGTIPIPISDVHDRFGNTSAFETSTRFSSKVEAV